MSFVSYYTELREEPQRDAKIGLVLKNLCEPLLNFVHLCVTIQNELC
jgi:hypothetical protein